MSLRALLRWIDGHREVGAAFTGADPVAACGAAVLALGAIGAALAAAVAWLL